MPIDGGHHLAGELRAGGERAEQQVARAGAAVPGAADADVGLGLVEGAPEVDVHVTGASAAPPRAVSVMRAWSGSAR